MRPDENELARAIKTLRAAKSPLIIAGGGVLYSQASPTLAAFAETHGIPVAETQAGKSSLSFTHPLNMGSIGVTGTAAANQLAAEADVILAVGTRLQDFTTGSWALFKNPEKTLIGLNTQPYDAMKHRGQALVADARAGLEELSANLAQYAAPASWTALAKTRFAAWIKEADRATAPTNALPSDAQVIGAVQRALGRDITLVCAAGGLPGELHKLWQASEPSSYHLEYGFSTMGYEIAGGLGVKMAMPHREVVVMVGDGSYLMLNSEIATSVMLGMKIIIVVLDNHGYGCITRLQTATGGVPFNNLFEDARHIRLPNIDFVRNAESLGATARKASSIAELQEALSQAKTNDRTTVVVIDTDPLISTAAGGHWWDVAVPQVSDRKEVNEARSKYDAALKAQRIGD